MILRVQINPQVLVTAFTTSSFGLDRSFHISFLLPFPPEFSLSFSHQPHRQKNIRLHTPPSESLLLKPAPSGLGDPLVPRFPQIDLSRLIILQSVEDISGINSIGQDLFDLASVSIATIAYQIHSVS